MAKNLQNHVAFTIFVYSSDGVRQAQNLIAGEIKFQTLEIDTHQLCFSKLFRREYEALPKEVG